MYKNVFSIKQNTELKYKKRLLPKGHGYSDNGIESEKLKDLDAEKFEKWSFP